MRRPTGARIARRSAKLIAVPRLRRAVERGLRLRWSPQQITARLVLDYPDDLEMRVSHETIYQSLFVQGRVERPTSTNARLAHTIRNSCPRCSDEHLSPP